MHDVHRIIHLLPLPHENWVFPFRAASNGEGGVSHGLSQIHRHYRVQAQGFREDVLEVHAVLEGGEGDGRERRRGVRSKVGEYGRSKLGPYVRVAREEVESP